MRLPVTLLGQPPSFVLHSSGHRALSILACRRVPNEGLPSARRRRETVFPGVYGWISSWSRSDGSVTGRSFCGMMSAADRSKRTECFTSFFRLRGHAGLESETIRKMLIDEPGVVRIRLGRKKTHTTYSVPDSVARRIHQRLSS